MPHFVVHVEEARKIVISSRIMKVDINSKTFNNIFEQLTTGKFYLHQVEVYVSKDGAFWTFVQDGLKDELSLMSTFAYTHIKFVTQAEEELPIDNTSTLAAAAHFNAFNRIMQSSAQQPSLPSLKTEDNQNNLLFNDIIRLLQQRKVKWNGNLHETAGKKFIERLAALIWYIDPHLDKFCARSLHLPVLFQELSLYKQNTTYNQFYHHGKHKKEKLSHAKLEELVQSLSISVTQPWACSKVWEPIIQEVLELIQVVKKYSHYLNIANERMQEIHHSDVPARDPTVDLKVYTINSTMHMERRYGELSEFLRSKEDYEYVNLESFLPDDVFKRHTYIKELQFDVAVTIYRYHQGNYLGTLNYIWKVPSCFNDRDETKLAQIMASLQKLLPKFYTRQMRKNALHKYSLIKQVTPAVLRTLYYDLTGDAAVTNDVISKEIENRLRIMLALEDPSIIVDLRINNGFKGSTFDAFWDEMAGFFNEKILAVDDRRHHDILYMPLAMSVQHLRDIIIKRLQNKFSTPLPNEIQIPCEEWIRLQFSPTNPIAASAIHYTGRFNVKFQIQTCLLRKEHPDSHYCACLFRYLREFAILFRDYVCLICADDKHKVPIGKGMATSTGVRNKKSMVLKEANLVACDHDFTKLSLTPSVTFICKVPLSIEESFYDGQVFVSYKDTIFQPSTAIRHTTEFFNAISAYYPQTIPPILCIYTDGGPDHRVTYGSVQISLICLFLCGDFDMLIALRTAPHQSWTNPAERIMSILNLAL
ncbi:unnamed protein product [Rhizophagus irregularis]|nr:unnamed protein product [Rhizophagus irregularis]